MLQLEVQNSHAKGKRFKLKGDISIGSDKACTIKIAGEDVRPQHARLYRTEDQRNYIEVLDQQAHIFVNNRDVLSSELVHNDQVKVGPLRLKVIDESVESRASSRLDQLLASVDDASEVYDFAKEDLFYLTNKDPSLAKAIAFTIPSKDRFIDQAQQFLARLVKQSGMDEMKVEAFMTCTKELILNAHRHGHEYDEGKTITLRYRDQGERIELTIEDQGPGFDHKTMLDKVRNLSAADAARARYQAGGFGGLGFQMICRMAERIEYNEPGNIVTFAVTKEL
jgi:anti-sigma regulatory factor (Ser/Thr protein kinase)